MRQLIGRGETGERKRNGGADVLPAQADGDHGARRKVAVIRERCRAPFVDWSADRLAASKGPLAKALDLFHERQAPGTVVALLSVAMGAIIFGNQTYELQIFTATGVTAVFALSESVLLSGAGDLSVAQGGLYGVGAYAAGILVTRAGMDYAEAIAFAVGIAALVALAIGVIACRSRRLVFAIVTLGVGIALSGVFAGWSSLTGGVVGLSGIRTMTLPTVNWVSSSSSVALSQYVFVWCSVIVVALIVGRLFRGPFGHVLRSIRGDAFVVEALGARVQRYRLGAFVVAGAIAGLAGCLYTGTIGYVAPGTFTVWASLSAIVIVVVGGLSSPWGTVLAACVLTIVPNLVLGLQQDELIIYAGILYLVLVLRGRTRLGGLS